jgi:protein-tyrosine phosphatase
VRGYIDLHCHYVPGIDDGVRSGDEGTALLRALKSIGFDRVVATPHMRPGMFDNTKAEISQAFASYVASLTKDPALPELELSSEHYFDDVVFQRLLAGEGLPYPGGRAVLLEFYEVSFQQSERQLMTLKVRGLLPVIAHPERYRYLWRSPETLERLVDAGVAALLDTAALVGKYGREVQVCAEELLERGLYHAACSDAHRPGDVIEVGRGMQRIEELYGPEELEFLFSAGPQALLSGVLPE